MLDPAGRQARLISHIWWVFFWTTFIIYVAVLAFMVISLIRRRVAEKDGLAVTPISAERRLTYVVGGAVGGSVLVLIGLISFDFYTGHRVYSLQDPNAVSVNVVGHQWWWEIQYDAKVTSNIVTTANELHLPVGRPVLLNLASRDVIHSLWIPNLLGKKDLIPGHETQTWLRADRAGTYFGQCAEFCGVQHAHMRFVVTAEPSDKFEAWLAAQRLTAPDPSTYQQNHGRQVFLTNSCVMCHTVQGTIARAKLGPDLTHIASRPMIAAGTAQNTRTNLSQWILDPGHFKPGVNMPQNNISRNDLNDLVSYLETLK